MITMNWVKNIFLHMERFLALLIVMVPVMVCAQEREADFWGIVELMETGETPDQPSLYDMAEELNTVDGYAIVAYLLYQDGEYLESIYYCEKCISLKPLCFSAILLRGLCNYAIGYRQKSFQDLCLVLMPDECRPGQQYELDAQTQETLLMIGNTLAGEHYKSAKKRMLKQ